MAVSIYVPSNAHSETRVTLNNQVFYIELKWNTRETAWYFSLYDVNKISISTGVKLCYGVVPTRKISDTLNGNIYIVNTTDSKDDIGRNNLGQGLQYQLVYLTLDEELEIF